jgi:hypothetical protein
MLRKGREMQEKENQQTGATKPWIFIPMGGVLHMIIED